MKKPKAEKAVLTGPEQIRPGLMMRLQGSGWPDAPVVFEAGGRALLAGSISRGYPTTEGVLPEAGEFSIGIGTVGWASGKLEVTARSLYEKGPRATLKVTVEPWAERKPNGKPANKAMRRALDFFNKRFRHIGYIPQNVRRKQFEALQQLRRRGERRFGDTIY